MRDQNNNTSAEKTNVIEIYNPTVSLKSTINTIEVSWIPSKLTNVEYVLKKDGVEIYKGTDTNFVDSSIIRNTNYSYTLETVHNSNTELVFSGNKLSGDYTIQIFGDIQLETTEISINSISHGENVTFNKIKFNQIADIEKEYSIKMKMTPFTSISGGNISSSNFFIDDALLKDDVSNTLSVKDLSFIDNVPTILISNAETLLNKKITLEVLSNNLKLVIPKELKLNSLSDESFSSTITYLVEWGP